ncbi:MAG TPA: hypothetical protein VHP59_06875, partial [Vineibacter terrae]|nr:hypothetical protein [Vineibacter terrae]
MTALPFIENSEVFFGLVGPVGVDLKLVSKCLEVELTRLNYRTVVVRLSDLLFSTIFRPQQKFDSEFDRLDQLMTAGDQLRANSKQTDALAMLAVYALHEARRAITGDSRITGDALKQPERIAYIFHSLKHPGEASLLRNLYGRLFNLVSVYAPRHERLDALAQRLAQSETNSDPKRFRAHAEQLIERDMQAGNEFGQNVQDTFPLADFFLRLSSEDSMREHIRRYIEILFGYQFHTPTRDEHGMFNAKAAALRSADLSRQVGAILASHQGDILGSGCNEVPMAGGGIVWCDDEVNDHRDLRLGYDTNAKKKGEILGEILNELKRAGWLARAKSRMDTKSL